MSLSHSVRVRVDL